MKKVFIVAGILFLVALIFLWIAPHLKRNGIVDKGSGSEELAIESDQIEGSMEQVPDVNPEDIPPVSEFAEGGQLVVLPRWNFPKDGLEGFVGILKEYVDMPERLNVGYFTAHFLKNGESSFIKVNLDSFDESGKNLGMYTYDYIFRDYYMAFSPPNPLYPPVIPLPYEDIFTVSHLSEILGRIPLLEQVEKLDFSSYILIFNRGYNSVKIGEPIIEVKAREEIPALSMEEYLEGLGGIEDGNPGIFLRLDNVQGPPDERFIYYKIPLDN